MPSKTHSLRHTSNRRQAPRLLVASPDAEFVALAERGLTAENYRLDTVTDASQLQEAMGARHYSLVLFDDALAGGNVDGILQGAPFILITSTEDPKVLAAIAHNPSLNAGFVGHLVKPVAHSSLIAQVRVALTVGRIHNKRNDVVRVFAGIIEEEHAAMARELHDDIGSELNALLLDVTLGAERLPPEVRDATRDLVEHLRQSIAQIGRKLVNITSRLQPEDLDIHEFRQQVKTLVGGWQQRVPSCQYSLTIGDDVDRGNHHIFGALLRILQESLNNIAKYASATQVEVGLTRHRFPEGDVLVLTVQDNGQGFDTHSYAPGIGIKSMRDRTSVLGGQFHAFSQPNHGTTIVATVPVDR